MMFAQLISIIGNIHFPIKPWIEASRVLITHLDTQIEASWMSFQQSVDMTVDHFNCIRAFEPPEDNNGKWTARIPDCNQNNTKCNINKFIMNHIEELKKLVKDISNLQQGLKTRELESIKKISEQTIKKNKFPWGKRTCRKFADLIIGLQSKSGRELLSSNYKEHNQLSNSLGYKFRQFPAAKIRSN